MQTNSLVVSVCRFLYAYGEYTEQTLYLALYQLIKTNKHPLPPCYRTSKQSFYFTSFILVRLEEPVTINTINQKSFSNGCDQALESTEIQNFTIYGKSVSRYLQYC